MILFRPVVYSPLYQYILACFAVSNFNVLVSSRMNLELPVFDGFRCHYRLLRVQVKLISELVNGCLKEKLALKRKQHLSGKDGSLIICSVVWCFVGFEGSKLWVHHWFHNRVSVFGDLIWLGWMKLKYGGVCFWHMNLAFVRIWSETCPSDCEGTACRATRTCADFLYTALCFNGVPLDLFLVSSSRRALPTRPEIVALMEKCGGMGL
ncbi:hypothetical protein F2Q68_00009435 [Brassica cretica]|uniref:Uncharacterized protein n=1 Tax=Brassica cretica TaxID=69181 RepID=A0A8S9KYX1_BRACR|nr:hypothetical protein F2Q68_00009435 [Brassica cretica]